VPMGWQQSYVLTGLLLILLIGILPSVGLYQDAFEEGMEIFVRYGQVRAAAALDVRTAQLREQYGGVAREHLLDARGAETRDIYDSSVFGGLTNEKQTALPDVGLRRQMARADARLREAWNALLSRVAGDVGSSSSGLAMADDESREGVAEVP